MVKFTFGEGNERTLGLGLSRDNLNKIVEGMPVLIKSSELDQLMGCVGWKGEILIVYGLKNSIINKGNEKAFVIGFNKKNVRYLKKGRLIKIKSPELEEIMGWKGKILIMYGDTEEEMKELISPFFGKNIKVIDKKKEYEDERRRHNDLGLP